MKNAKEYIEKVYAVLLSIRQVDFCFGVSEIVCMNDFTAKSELSN